MQLHSLLLEIVRYDDDLIRIAFPSLMATQNAKQEILERICGTLFKQDAVIVSI